PDVEGAHLRAAATAGRRHGEAHAVVDIHERQRTGGVRAGAGHVGAFRAQRGEFIADAAAGLQRESRLVHLAEDVVHGIGDGAGDGAVDGGRRRLVLLRAGIGRDAPGRDGAVAKRPQEPPVPVLAQVFLLDVGERARDALPGVIDLGIENRPVLGLEAVFLVPDVLGRGLHGYLPDRLWRRFQYGTHTGTFLHVLGCFFIFLLAWL